MANPKPSDSTPSSTLEQVLGCAPRAHPASPAVQTGALLAVDLELLDDNPFQPRVVMDEAKLEELAASIAQSGLLQPIAVRPTASGRYFVIAGHRRVAAYRLLRSRAKDDRKRYSAIRAQALLAFDDSQMAVSAYVENAQRADLSPIEEAAALARIRALAGAKTTKEIASLTGQAEQRVRKLLRLNEAPLAVQEAVGAGLLVDVSAQPAEGEPADAAKPRRERRRLDLYSAIELIRLHEHHARRKPATAEERTKSAIARALREGWGVRRIRDYVEQAVSGRQQEDLGGAPPETDSAAPPPLFSRTAKALTIHLGRLESASPEQRQALAKELHALVGELSRAPDSRSTQATSP